MAKKETSLKKFESVALEGEKARQIRGGLSDVSQLPSVYAAHNLVGWGEIEIRSAGFSLSTLQGPVSMAGLSKFHRGGR